MSRFFKAFLKTELPAVLDLVPRPATMPGCPTSPRRSGELPLRALGRDALANLTTKLNLAVQDRRAAAAHVDALMRSRTVEFPVILGEFQRDDLKAICDALGLDPSGRENEVLAKRILGGAGSAPVPGNGTAAVAVEEPAPGAKLTIDQLEAYPWGTADKLRGKMTLWDREVLVAQGVRAALDEIELYGVIVAWHGHNKPTDEVN